MGTLHNKRILLNQTRTVEVLLVFCWCDEKAPSMGRKLVERKRVSVSLTEDSPADAFGV